MIITMIYHIDLYLQLEIRKTGHESLSFFILSRASATDIRGKIMRRGFLRTKRWSLNASRDAPLCPVVARPLYLPESLLQTHRGLESLGSQPLGGGRKYHRNLFEKVRALARVRGRISSITLCELLDKFHKIVKLEFYSLELLNKK